MPLPAADRLLATAVVLLFISSAALLTGSSCRRDAWSADRDACTQELPEPHRHPRDADANRTRLLGGVGRLDDDSVVAALRQVIQAHGVATLLHYPCGDMAWAGPVIAAIQVRPDRSPYPGRTSAQRSLRRPYCKVTSNACMPSRVSA